MTMVAERPLVPEQSSKGKIESTEFSPAEGVERIKDSLLEEVGEERWEKIKAAQENEKLLELLRSSPLLRHIFPKMVNFMPEGVFERILNREEGALVSHLIKLRDRVEQFEDSDLKFAKIVEFAYGGHTENRFASTAALYALDFIRRHKNADGELDGTMEQKFANKLRHHFHRYQARREKISSAEPDPKKRLRFGVEIELEPRTIVGDPGDYYKDEFVSRFRTEVEELTGMLQSKEGNITVEIKTEPTSDIYLLVFELILLRRLGFLNYERLNLGSSEVGNSHSHGVHLNTGGLDPSRFRNSEDILLLSHTEEASALTSPFVNHPERFVQGISIIKGELIRRDTAELKWLNEQGIEQRIFQAYSEKNLLEFLVRHAAKARALKAFQSLPREQIEKLRAVSDAYRLYPVPPEPPRPSDYINSNTNREMDPDARVRFEMDREQYLRKRAEYEETEKEHQALKYDESGEEFKKQLDQLDHQIDKILSEVSHLNLTPQEKALIKIWVRYRFKTTLLFRNAKLPNPSIPWGAKSRQKSPERAKLYRLIGGSARQYSDFKKAARELPGFSHSPRLGEERYANLMEAMRTLDIELSQQIAKIDNVPEAGPSTAYLKDALEEALSRVLQK